MKKPLPLLSILALTLIAAAGCRSNHMAAKRPVDVSLDSSKALSMGYAPRDIKNALTATIEMMDVL